MNDGILTQLITDTTFQRNDFIRLAKYVQHLNPKIAITFTYVKCTKYIWKPVPPKEQRYFRNYTLPAQNPVTPQGPPVPHTYHVPLRHPNLGPLPVPFTVSKFLSPFLLAQLPETKSESPTVQNTSTKTTPILQEKKPATQQPREKTTSHAEHWRTVAEWARSFKMCRVK